MASLRPGVCTFRRIPRNISDQLVPLASIAISRNPIRRYRNIGNVIAVGARQLHSTKSLQLQKTAQLLEKPVYDNSHLIRLRKLQAKFQAKNGEFVHLKGGPMDKFWYYLSWAGCTIGGAYSVYYIIGSYSDA